VEQFIEHLQFFFAMVTTPYWLTNAAKQSVFLQVPCRVGLLKMHARFVSNDTRGQWTRGVAQGALMFLNGIEPSTDVDHEARTYNARPVPVVKP
jgi:hypothetical protein